MAIDPEFRARTRSRDMDIRRQCAEAIGDTVRAGSEFFDRARHLPWLAGAMPAELEGNDPGLTRTIIGRLERALRAERQRGKAGHWTYDMNRHIALMQALKAERYRLKTAVQTGRSRETGKLKTGTRNGNAPAGKPGRGA
jgi:Family of unknown function (DUF6477)